MEEKERMEGAVIEEPVEVPKSSWVLVAQFFFVPLIIVGLCVGVFILFGLITGETRSAREYLEEVKAGKGNRRWQAAYELSKYLNYKGSKQMDPRLGRDLSTAFVNAREDDPRVRQYLALAMGRLRDKSAVEPLIQSLKESDPDTRLYVVSALGDLGDTRAVEPLLNLLPIADRGLRKITVYSLGLLQDARAVPELQASLNDNWQDVRWNAALSLARFRDRSGLEVLHQMLDRKRLSESAEVNESQKSEAIKNAVRAVALLNDASARPLLEVLSNEDPDIEVRAAALDALKQIK